MPNVAAVRSPQVSGLQGLVANARYFLTQRTYSAALCAEAVLWPTDTVLMNDGTGNLQSIALPAVALSGSYNDLSDQPTIPDDAAARIAGDTALSAQIASLTAGSPAELNTFLEAYNRFLSDESASSANVAAISAEATTRAAADATEASARAAADTTNANAISSEATSRASADTTLQANINGKFTTPTGTVGQYLRGDGSLATFPTIPVAQVNSDWNASSGLAQILNKPTLFAAADARSSVSLTTTGAGAATYSSATGVLNVPTPTLTGGTVTSVTGTAPVASSGGNTPAISMAAATTSVPGYLTAADWTTFNAKQAAFNAGTGLTLSGGTLSVTANTYQPLDAGLTDLASDTALGLFYRSAVDTYDSVTVSSPLTFTTGTLAIAAATTGAAGSLSASDKTKLDSLTIIGGADATPFVNKTTAYTATANDGIIFCDTTAAAFTLTLPVSSTYISGSKMRPVLVVITGSKTLTVQPVSGMIDNRTKDTITSTYTIIEYWPTPDGVNYVAQ